jgi:hypothetical protein
MFGRSRHPDGRTALWSRTAIVSAGNRRYGAGRQLPPGAGAEGDIAMKTLLFAAALGFSGAALAQTDAAATNAAAPADAYPACSKTVTDKCTETPAAHHAMATPHKARHASKIVHRKTKPAAKS